MLKKEELLKKFPSLPPPEPEDPRDWADSPLF
jgi:hypothetical protein